MNSILIQQIDMQHPLYQEERELRNRVLLRPYNLPDYGWEMKDPMAWHFLAIDEGRVIGCVLLAPLNEEKTRVQLMQMAVDDTYQGKGIGKRLVDGVKEFARQQGINWIKCHARENAIPYYQKQGFVIYGEEFEEVGIRHRYMAWEG